MTKVKNDLTGQRFGRLVVQHQAEDQIRPNGVHRTMWHCLCDCGNEKDIRADGLTGGTSKSCGCLNHDGSIKIGRRIDLTGQKIGRLKVVKRMPSKIEPSGKHRGQWLCKCDCGNETIAETTHLTDGHTRSCGCYQLDCTKEALTKYNKYDLTGRYGICYAANTNEEILFDLEDYDKIKNYTWSINSDGYAISETYGKPIRMQRLLCDVLDNSSVVVDHMDGNTLNNQKWNLRVCHQRENTLNKGLMTNNKSGVAGVRLNPSRKTWHASISLDGVEYNLGNYESFEKACAVRRSAEDRLFGEYSRYNSLQVAKEFESKLKEA